MQEDSRWTMLICRRWTTLYVGGGLCYMYEVDYVNV